MQMSSINYGGMAIRDRGLGIFDPTNAADVQKGREEGGRNVGKAAKAKGGIEGGAAGKGAKKPHMIAAEKANLGFQGFCTGCGKQGVVGPRGAGWRASE